jgi:type II secretion system protein H
MRSARLRGFSLLELMVVVTIIGIFIGVAVLSINVTGTDRDSEQEAFRLKSLLELMREESLLQGIDYGVLFHRDGYQFYFFDYARNEWLLPGNDRLLGERTLPESLEMEVAVDDRKLVLEPRPEIEDGESTSRPQVMLLATGEMTPFNFEVFRDPLGTRFVLSGEFDGTMEIQQSE